MMIEVLNIDLSFDRQDLRVLIPVVGGLIGFIIFWFTQKSEKLKHKFLDKYGTDLGYARFIMFTRYLGGFSMGVLPALAFFIAFPNTTLSQLGLGFNEKTFLTSILWIAGLSAVVIPLASFSARKPKHLVNYPQIRARKWDTKMILSNLASWAIYLLGYEFLFRGVLFFPLVEEIGLWPAIAVNIGMYSGTHIPKGIEETIGAIILSIILCLLTVQTGTIWIAFFVHVAMAWTNTLTALKHNPDMKIVKNING